MAFDDLLVIILIVAVVVFLFGASRIPKFARSLGMVRREFENGSKGIYSNSSNAAPNQPNGSLGSSSQTDPLVVAAQREGIDTNGKTKEQIASELSWKLNKA